jgi:uncharacterized protein (DUF2147 family)
MKYFTILLFLFTGINLSAQSKADQITGVWLTAGKDRAKIQITKSADKYVGKIIWLQYPDTNGHAKMDTKNPDETKRSRPIVGLPILEGFAFNGTDKWEDGKIYDPASGKTYSCYMWLEDHKTLKVRGYIGISLLGRSETWTRE